MFDFTTGKNYIVFIKRLYLLDVFVLFIVTSTTNAVLFFSSYSLCSNLFVVFDFRDTSLT
jgi:hypothetical protein